MLFFRDSFIIIIVIAELVQLIREVSQSVPSYAAATFITRYAELA
jgi:hypothetical protein